MPRALEAVEIEGRLTAEYERVLTKEALSFFHGLHKRFNQRRQELLAARDSRMAQLNGGKFPQFLSQTQDIRSAAWQVGNSPSDLLDRRVEITGPVEKKMMINALNSGANVFMADFEDANSPTWDNVVQGQLNCFEAVRRTLSFTNAEGKNYSLNQKTATLVVRPRGFHLSEKHVRIDGQPVSASLFDFALYFFHNAAELLKRDSGPYFYLPKLESHLEARLWNDVFNYAQDELKIERGTIRATVLIETILAAFEMDEILFELKDHCAGLNAGRWDYIFSMIKKFCGHKEFFLPDRSQITMTVPFMKAYCDLLVKTCHLRGAHAMGGILAAFIPSRKDREVNERALAKVKEDKEREAACGFDGTWVAHPDLVPVAKACFDAVLGKRPHQKDTLRADVQVSEAELLNTYIEGGSVSEEGLRSNIEVALQYIESWLRGVGAAAIHNLMEDAATAEISRAQIWQWIHLGARLADGRTVTLELYEAIRAKELAQLTKQGPGRFEDAAKILDGLIDNRVFVEFLTIPAYALLNDGP